MKPYLVKAKENLPVVPHQHCELCNSEEFNANVEAYEISGMIVCDECADQIFEENSQFGIGA